MSDFLFGFRILSDRFTFMPLSNDISPASQPSSLTVGLWNGGSVSSLMQLPIFDKELTVYSLRLEVLSIDAKRKDCERPLDIDEHFF
jgi:hypothetical protein